MPRNQKLMSRLTSAESICSLKFLFKAIKRKCSLTQLAIFVTFKSESDPHSLNV